MSDTVTAHAQLILEFNLENVLGLEMSFWNSLALFNFFRLNYHRLKVHKSPIVYR